MATSPQKVAPRLQSRLMPWSRTVAAHLGQYLTPTQLNDVYLGWHQNNIALWGLFEDGSHVGTLATKIEPMNDGSRHWVFVHCGGKWIHQLEALQAFFTNVAHQYHCDALRLDMASPRIARIARKRLYNFKTYEVSILCPISKRGGA